MSPLPVEMRDRWASRPEPPEGKGTVYWHVLMSRYPEVRAAASAAQEALKDIAGLHLTPSQWFHMTVQLVGSTDDVGRDKMMAMLQNVRRALVEVRPLDAVLCRVLYHPEAVMLAVEPSKKLQVMGETVRDATSSELGQTKVSDDAKWIPHVTVAYSEGSQPAGQIISALGSSIPVCRFTVDEISLVVQWGPERSWNWEELGTVELHRT